MQGIRLITICLLASVVINLAVAWTVAAVATPPPLPRAWLPNNEHLGILCTPNPERVWLCQVVLQTGVTTVIWLPAHLLEGSVEHIDVAGNLGGTSAIPTATPRMVVTESPVTFWTDPEDLHLALLPTWAHAPLAVPESAWPVLRSDRQSLRRFLMNPPRATPFHAASIAAGWPLRSFRSDSIVANNTRTVHGGLQVALASNPDLLLPFHLLPLGFAVNTALYGCVIWPLVALPRLARRHLRRRRGCCPDCAYPIGSSPACPECGHPLRVPAVA